VTPLLLPAVLASSLVGSVHCLAMCGPLVSLAQASTAPRSFQLGVSHSLGRLVTYVTLGATAGLIGRAVDLAGDLGAVQRAATLLAGVAIIAWGVWGLAVALGVRGDTSAPHGALFRRGLVSLRTKRAATRAALLGVLTGLLPCGWLWAFVVSAASTGGAARGAAVMAVFWLGTVPAMLGVFTFAGPLIRQLRARLPVVTPLVLVVLGVVTLSLRWRDAGATQVEHPHCHDPAAIHAPMAPMPGMIMETPR
jgi:hypothetical protein